MTNKAWFFFFIICLGYITHTVYLMFWPCIFLFKMKQRLCRARTRYRRLCAGVIAYPVYYVCKKRTKRRSLGSWRSWRRRARTGSETELRDYGRRGASSSTVVLFLLGSFCTQGLKALPDVTWVRRRGQIDGWLSAIQHTGTTIDVGEKMVMPHLGHKKKSRYVFMQQPWKSELSFFCCCS